MPKDKKHLFYPHDFMSRKTRAYSGFVAKTGDQKLIAKLKGNFFL